MKKYLVIALSLLVAVSVAACSQRSTPTASTSDSSQSADSTSSAAPSSSTPASQPELEENQAFSPSGMKDAAADTVFGVRLHYAAPVQADLAAQTVDQFKYDDSSTYLYVVPRYVGSAVVVESIEFDDKTNDFIATGKLFEAVCSQDYALLVQAELPEGIPGIRITVTNGDMTASYIPAYDGKGDTVYPLLQDGVLLDEAPLL